MSTRLSVYAYTRDLGLTRRFYEGGLHVKPAFQAGNWLPFDIGDATFALHGVRDDARHALQRFNLSFDVDEIDAVVARVERQGGRVLRGVADEAFGKRAILQDPDGRQLEIVQHAI